MAESLILDTQTAIWVTSRPELLGRKTHRRIIDASKVYISTISIVEKNIADMRSSFSPKEDWAIELGKQGYLVADFPLEAATALTRFGSLVRHDPFDRMILAHAVALSAKLLTSGAVLLGLGLDWILDSRD